MAPNSEDVHYAPHHVPAPARRDAVANTLRLPIGRADPRSGFHNGILYRPLPHRRLSPVASPLPVATTPMDPLPTPPLTSPGLLEAQEINSVSPSPIYTENIIMPPRQSPHDDTFYHTSCTLPPRKQVQKATVYVSPHLLPVENIVPVGFEPPAYTPHLAPVVELTYRPILPPQHVIPKPETNYSYPSQFYYNSSLVSAQTQHSSPFCRAAYSNLSEPQLFPDIFQSESFYDTGKEDTCEILDSSLVCDVLSYEFKGTVFYSKKFKVPYHYQSQILPESECPLEEYPIEINSDNQDSINTPDVVPYECKDAVFYQHRPKFPNYAQCPTLPKSKPSLENYPSERNSDDVDCTSTPDVASLEHRATEFYLQKPKCPHVEPGQIQTVQIPKVVPMPGPVCERQPCTDSRLQRERSACRLKRWLWKSNRKMLFLCCLYMIMTGGEKNARNKKYMKKKGTSQ